MASNGASRQYLPLTCHGHSRPVPHISFSSLEKDGEYFIVSACKGTSTTVPSRAPRYVTM